MWLKLYESLKIFGGEMNELYKDHGVEVRPVLSYC